MVYWGIKSNNEIFYLSREQVYNGLIARRNGSIKIIKLIRLDNFLLKVKYSSGEESEEKFILVDELAKSTAVYQANLILLFAGFTQDLSVHMDFMQCKTFPTFPRFFQTFFVVSRDN